MLTGKDFLTHKDVLEKAAEFKGFEIAHLREGEVKAASKDLYEFKLDPSDENLTALLRENKFEFDRSEKRREFYIALDDIQKYSDNPSCGFFEDQSFCWEKGEIPPHALEVGVYMWPSEKKNGVILIPYLMASAGGACYRPTINKLLKVLVGYFKPANTLLNEIVANGGETTVNWSDMGLDGLRSLGAVFSDFAASTAIESLAVSNSSPFRPEPRKRYFNQPVYYVPERIRPQLVEQWNEQLTDFRESLRRGV